VIITDAITLQTRVPVKEFWQKTWWLTFSAHSVFIWFLVRTASRKVKIN